MSSGSSPAVRHPDQATRVSGRGAQPRAILAVVDRVGYAERRTYVVPGSLAELAGPAGGLVRLPPALAWTGRAEYDLDDDADRIVFYERVLVEATDVAALAALLNEELLRACWG